MVSAQLVGKLRDLMDEMDRQKIRSKNPWFSIPLNVSAIDAKVRECFTGDALVLAELASTDQRCFVGYLYSAACDAYGFGKLPISEALMRLVLSNIAYNLKIKSAHDYKLPWNFALSRPLQNVQVEQFLPQVADVFQSILVEQGVACRSDKGLVLAPIFHALAHLS